jgi:hypothetical protein
MSIEQSLERIANALEASMAKDGMAARPLAETESDKPKRGRPAKAPETATAPVEIDPLTGEPIQPVLAAAAITLDQVRDALRAHMKTNGIEKTKALMIKFGAPVANPVVTGIPVTNYAALLKECV